MSQAIITLVLGGARSGKSHYAQALAAQVDKVVYLATAQASDDQMRAKIERHRRERPAAWTTVEVPFELETAVEQHGKKGVVLLIDCLTTFTANLMMAKAGNEDAIFKHMERVRSALVATAAKVIIVSNEVGSGVVPAFPSGHQFCNLLGEVNQQIAQISTNVVVMFAGCPLALKGQVEIHQ